MEDVSLVHPTFFYRRRLLSKSLPSAEPSEESDKPVKESFRREQTIASEKAGGAHGPLRASAHIRVSARFDYQFMHDRGDYKSGWQMEKEWEEAEKARKIRLAAGEDADPDEEGANLTDEEDDDSLPFACFICRKPFLDPVVTKCKHYFCEHCALKVLLEEMGQEKLFPYVLFCLKIVYALKTGTTDNVVLTSLMLFHEGLRKYTRGLTSLMMILQSHGQHLYLQTCSDAGCIISCMPGINILGCISSLPAGMVDGEGNYDLKGAGLARSDHYLIHLSQLYIVSILGQASM